MRHRILFAALLALALPNGVDLADDESETLEMGLAGLLLAPNRKELPKLTLSAGAALAAEPMRLKSGSC
ncbi:hypothetical protein [Sinorhizobium fredii]|uniref:hypothetical protein n=1 Tax=Rhizobium fredii TaxID=380 RepID=UPI0004B26C2F|nr:hypothetical protein [Sinorhizobium fredii]ASY71728.1 hypothetical protein SF83666_b50790 [Sinorhizobium fredii CCBAU 83666]GEC32006.1 hypothetical protein EFR01_21770 [Sinorhizobium fredii]GLS08047.1 hypothetical protein GCM10007864_16750 [Sinorhizobium fredii]